MTNRDILAAAILTAFMGAVLLAMTAFFYTAMGWWSIPLMLALMAFAWAIVHVAPMARRDERVPPEDLR